MKLGPKTRDLLILVGLFLLWVGLIRFDIWTTKPSTEAKSFEGFLETMRKPREIEKLTINNEGYILVSGKMPPLWFVTFPSGGPCYVYDKNGLLVDWAADVGDNSRFTSQWLTQSSREKISIEQVRELLRAMKGQTL